MKKLALALACLMMLSALTLTAFAMEEGANVGKVPTTSDTIKVDAKMDEVYKKGLAIDVATAYNDASKNGKSSAKAYFVWNGKDTIYAYVDVKDANVTEASDADYKSSPWTIDSIELFLDYTNKNGRARDQYRIDYAGRPTFHDNSKTYYDDLAKYGFKSYAATKTSTGYAVEFEIVAYKESLANDMKIGFQVQINDMQGDAAKTRYIYVENSKIKPDGKATSFDYFTLSADKVTGVVATTAAAKTTTTTTTTAAKTADAGIVVALVAIAAAGSAIVVSKKRK